MTGDASSHVFDMSSAERLRVLEEDSESRVRPRLRPRRSEEIGPSGRLGCHAELERRSLGTPMIAAS